MEREKLIATVTAAQSGDSDALNELFNTFYNDVYYFALKTVKDDDLACDITQEAFVEIINTIGDLHEPAAFVKWMKQITYHQCTRYFKKKKDVLVDEDEEGNTVFDTLKEEKTEFIPDEALDQQDFRDTILAMLDELSEEQRSATMLYYYDEMSVKQIAEIQNVSEGTVKSRLNYARKSIKNSVETYEKKNGVKLHCAGVLPLLLWLLSQTGKETMPAAAANAVAGGVTAATGVTISAATVSAGGAAVATATATTVATATSAGIAAKIAALPVVAKVVAGVVAGALVLGGVGLAVLPEKEPVATDPIVTTAPSDTSPTHTEVTQPSTEETLPPETTLPTIESTFPTTDPTISTTSPIETTNPPKLNYVPAGCTYTLADGTVLEAGQPMPQNVSEGDEFATATYLYKYSYIFGADNINDLSNGSWHFVSYLGGWSVITTDKTQPSYPALMAEINGMPLVDMSLAFANCTAMTAAPEIPESIMQLGYTYMNCTSLTAAPDIPEGMISMCGTFMRCTALEKAPSSLPESVTDMSGTFVDCISLTTAPIIPESVTDMSFTFSGCTSLTTAPIIPEGVTDISGTFADCISLTTAPVIPEGVTDMSFTFSGCTSITSAPIIPESVTNMSGTFAGCTALTSAPVIPEGVTDMSATFADCTSLTAAPIIPEGVTNMHATFRDCTYLASAPMIPVSVTEMSRTFYGCHALTGAIEINANPTTYDLCFAYTEQPITLTGSSTKLAELVATGNNGNVTVQLAE